MDAAEKLYSLAGGNCSSAWSKPDSCIGFLQGAEIYESKKCHATLIVEENCRCFTAVPFAVDSSSTGGICADEPNKIPESLDLRNEYSSIALQFVFTRYDYLPTKHLERVLIYTRGEKICRPFARRFEMANLCGLLKFQNYPVIVLACVLCCCASPRTRVL